MLFISLSSKDSLLSAIAIKINDRYTSAHKSGLNYSQCFLTSCEKIGAEGWQASALDLRLIKGALLRLMDKKLKFVSRLSFQQGAI